MLPTSKMRTGLHRRVGCGALAWALGAWLAMPGLAAAADTARRSVVPMPVITGALDNQGVLELETGGWADGSSQIAADIAGIVDDGSTRRILPVMGKGSNRTLTDLVTLHGVDMAILQTDVLEVARDTHRIANIEGAISYITRLPNLEFHLLARPGIDSVSGLAGLRVNFDSRDSGTAVTAQRIFGLLNIPVIPTYDNEAVALAKLRNHQIDAIALVATKPVASLQQMSGNDGLHLLSIPSTQTAEFYPQTRLSADDYFGLVPQDVPVNTVAVGTVLAVINFPANSPRYARMANFTETFFTNLPTLLQPGHLPAWEGVNVSADLPGWHRFPPAEQWLKRNVAVVSKQSPADLKAIFSLFIEKRSELLGEPAIPAEQRNELYDKFEQWQREQPH